MSFPTPTSNGELYTINGYTYQWFTDQSIWKIVSKSSTISNATINNATINVSSFAGEATFNANLFVNSSVVTVGNTSVNVSINSTSFSGTSNNSSYLGGNSVSTILTYANNKAANSYSNAVTYADFAAANAYSNAIAYSGNAAQAYSNATTYADNKAANAYSNAVTYAGNKADNAYSNAIAYTNTGIALKSGTTFTGLVTHTANVAVNGAIIAGGNSGMSGQFLTSNGDGNVYWSGLTASINTGNLSAQSVFVTSGNLSIGNTQVNTDISNTGVYISNTTTNVFMQIDSFRVPTGNVGQRPASLLAGLLRYNTQLSDMEYANGTAWIPLSSQETLTSNNISINNAITIGNSTVNNYINSTAAAITKIVSGNTQANSTSVNTTNFVSTTANITGNTYINKLIANSALGTNGQFLTSNSTGGIYWSTGVGNIAADAMTIGVGNLSIGNTTVNTDISNNGLFIQNTSSSATLNVTGFNAGNATSNLAFYTTLIGAASVEYGPAYTINSVNLTNGPGGLGVYAPQGGAYATASNLFFVNASLMQIGNSTSYVTFRGSRFNIGTMITGNSLGIYTSNLSVNNIIANGSQGTNGQILTSNGTGMYWAAGVGNLAADAISISVGNLSIGNSTVNTDMSNTGIFISNTTSTATLNIATFAIGNSTVNTTINSNSIRSTNLAITTVIANGATGANGQILTANSTGGAYWGTGVANLSASAITITTGNLSIGNTTVNTDVSNNGIFISNATSSVTLNVSGLNIGNSSVNATMNSTAFAMPSAKFTGNLTVNNTIFVGDSSVNTTTNTSGIYLKGNGYTVSVNTAVSVNLTAGGSIGFNGSNSYITGTITNSPGTSTGGAGIGDFCMEAWVRPSALASGDTPGVFTLMNGTGTNTGFWLYVNSGGWGVRNNTGDIVAYSVAPTINTFYHVAVSRSSGTLTLYINGVGVATTSTNYTFSDTTFSVGAFNSTYFNGYISNIRYVWASPVYTSNFTPPTSPLGVYGTFTELLLVQSTSATYLTETSGYSVAITTAGAPFYSTLSPFSALTYSTVNVGGFYTSGKVNAASVNSAVYTVGSVFIANTSKITVGVPVLANGSTGTAGQVLTSNGSTGSPYWTTQATVANLAADAISISVGNLSIGNTTVNTDISNNGVFISNTTSSVTLNVSGLNIGNSTVNATMNSTAFAMPSATFTGNLTVNNTLTVTGNLILAGSTTFVNSTVITTKDLNIIFANGAANSFLTDGAGIVAGTSANLVFDDPTKSWQTNVNITPYTNNLSLGATSKLFNLYANQIIANGSMGTAGQILTSNGTSTYWSTGGTVANLAADAISISVGNLSIGNTTVNTDISNNGVFISNTTSSVTLNVSGLTIGNATVNSVVNSSVFSGTSLSANNASYLGGNTAQQLIDRSSNAYSNAIAYSGNAALAYANAIAYSGNAAQAYSNAIAYTNTSIALKAGATFTGNVQVNATLAVNGAIALTGSNGTVGYFLTSNGDTGAPYWTSPGAAVVNVDAQYAWTNIHTFAANVTVNSEIKITGGTAATTGTGTLAFANNLLSMGNNTVNSTLSPTTLTMGGGSLTTTGTGGLTANLTTILIGNNTSNAVVNTSGFYIGGTQLVNINVATQFAWTNTQSFSNTITFGNATVNAAISTNSSVTSFSGTSNNSIYLNGALSNTYVSNAYLTNVLTVNTTSLTLANVFSFTGTANLTAGFSNTVSSVGNSYCLEFWVNFPTTNTTPTSVLLAPSPDGLVFQIANNGAYIGNYAYVTEYAGGFSIAANTWHHIAYIGTSNQTYLFVDGSPATWYTNSTFTTPTATPTHGGKGGSGGATQNGTLNTGGLKFYSTTSGAGSYKIIDFRVTTSNTVYSLSGFTPPTTHLTAITGTQILLFTSNVFTDAGLYSIVTTNNGGVLNAGTYGPLPSTNTALSLNANVKINPGISVYDSTGSQGTAGQVLTSNGTANVYWSTIATDSSTLNGNTAQQLIDRSSNAYSNAIAYSGNAALAYANAIAYSGNAALAYANAIAYSGNAALAYANAIAYTNANIALLTGASFTGLVTHTANLAVNGAIIAGGNSGTVGQVLTSNGSGNVYWSTVSGGGSINTAAQYTFTNTITFSNTIVIANVSANGTTGTSGQVLTSDGTRTYWSAPTIPQSNAISDSFTANGTQTTFVLTTSVRNQNNSIVTLDGMVQVPTTHYSITGTTLTMTSAPIANSIVEVRNFDNINAGGGGISTGKAIAMAIVFGG